MTDEPEVLDASRCWDHLRGAAYGRIAAVVDGAAVIRPVNFAVDHGTLLMRTGQGSLISSLVGGPVVFEADGTEIAAADGVSTSAWSVVMDGTMRAVAATDQLVDTLGVPLFPWHSSPKPVFVRMEPDTISGRRFEVVDASAWQTMLDDAHRSAPE